MGVLPVVPTAKTRRPFWHIDYARVALSVSHGRLAVGTLQVDQRQLAKLLTRFLKPTVGAVDRRRRSMLVDFPAALRTLEHGWRAVRPPYVPVNRSGVRLRDRQPNVFRIIVRSQRIGNPIEVSFDLAEHSSIHVPLHLFGRRSP